MKLATKSKSPPKAGAKVKPGASEAKPINKVAIVLSGGNPRIAKADGDAPMQAYMAGMPGRDLLNFLVSHSGSGLVQYALRSAYSSNRGSIACSPL